MNVKIRAVFVARIFDIIAWVILIVGGLAAVLNIVVGLFGAFADTWISSVVIGIGIGLAIAVMTAIYWAAVSLASIIAGYIAAESAE